MLLPVDLAVDSNRDGVIKFAGNLNDEAVSGKPLDVTTKDKPFRFWINSDNDSGNEEQPGVGPQDSSSNVIVSMRDLEDFTRLQLYIGGLQDAVFNGDIQVGLEWRNATGSPSIKIFAQTGAKGTNDYLKDSLFAAFDQLGPEGKTALGTIDSSGGFKFASTFWKGNSSGRLPFDKDHPTRFLLFEGVTEGNGQLVMTFWKGSDRVGEGGSVWLDLKNVRKMYARGLIDQDAPSIPNPWSNYNPSPLTWNWDSSFGTPEIDPSAEKKTIVYVHGWRMSPDEFLTWSDTTFKRLYHGGYKGLFYSFRWPTYYGGNGGNTPIDLFVPGSSTYNPSEYRAWLSGPALASFVNCLPNPNNRYLIAHSMGNVVSGAALLNGMKVNRYEMCNAAMAAMAYDSTIVDDNYQTPDIDSESTTRAKFGLANKFNAVSTTIISFSLPNDSALGTWSANNQYFKPQSFADGSEYKYYTTFPADSRLRFYPDPSNKYRLVTSVNEAMGYVTQSRSRAAGVKYSEKTIGSISSCVNMGAGGFEFGTTHSAEWMWSIQKTYPFWKEVLKQFQIDSGGY